MWVEIEGKRGKCESKRGGEREFRDFISVYHSNFPIVIGGVHF